MYEFETTLCDQVNKCLVADMRFSPGTDRPDITDVMLQVELNTITIPPTCMDSVQYI